MLEIMTLLACGFLVATFMTRWAGTSWFVTAYMAATTFTLVGSLAMAVQW